MPGAAGAIIFDAHQHRGITVISGFAVSVIVTAAIFFIVVAGDADIACVIITCHCLAFGI